MNKDKLGLPLLLQTSSRHTWWMFNDKYQFVQNHCELNKNSCSAIHHFVTHDNCLLIQFDLIWGMEKGTAPWLLDVDNSVTMKTNTYKPGAVMQILWPIKLKQPICTVSKAYIERHEAVRGNLNWCPYCNSGLLNKCGWMGWQGRLNTGWANFVC